MSFLEMGNNAAEAKLAGECNTEKAKNTVTTADAKVAGEAAAKALAVLKEFYDKGRERHRAHADRGWPEHPVGPEGGACTR